MGVPVHGNRLTTQTALEFFFLKNKKPRREIRRGSNYDSFS
jgi:hypothetical protein